MINNIRILQYKDIPYISEILEQWVVDPTINALNLNEIQRYLSYMKDSIKKQNGRKYFVAVTHDGKVVGVVGLKTLLEEIKKYARSSKPIEVINLYVNKNNRRKNVGKSLITNIENIASRMKYTEIMLISSPRYKESWDFYKKMGYQIVGDYEGEYNKQRGAKIFQKIL